LFGLHFSRQNLKLSYKFIDSFLVAHSFIERNIFISH
jgi:hypothetical protein